MPTEPNSELSYVDNVERAVLNPVQPVANLVTKGLQSMDRILERRTGINSEFIADALKRPFQQAASLFSEEPAPTQQIRSQAQPTIAPKP